LLFLIKCKSYITLTTLSILYKMNMYQLFKTLQRNLRWLLLIEFITTHSARNGKLIKKIVFDDRHQVLLDMPLIRQKIGIEYDTSFFWAETAVIMSDDRYLAYGEGSGSGRLAHGFRKIVPGDDDDNATWYGLNMEIAYMDDSVVIPPYEKHSYDRYGQEVKHLSIFR
jgi:hypothetical protein